MKIAIIVLYFGKFPSYFQLFLNSCEINKNYEWLIFGDDTEEYTYPTNVHFNYMTFKECRELIQSKFNFIISLNRPQKLCDYKCAYGYIFEKEVEGYTWWGHCDLDQIFGDLNHFITQKMLENYDKLFSLGHLTLYRNTYENNRMFMSNICGKERYKDVFSKDKGYGFDEWVPGNVNEIFLKSRTSVHLENYGADINPYKTHFSLVKYCMDTHTYIEEETTNSVFCWENGELFQIYEQNNQLKYREFPYIHLQKRVMRDKREKRDTKRYYIVPNKFIDGTRDVEQLLGCCIKWKIINYQFFKVKYNSLCYRIKSRDWERKNCFK